MGPDAGVAAVCAVAGVVPALPRGEGGAGAVGERQRATDQRGESRRGRSSRPWLEFGGPGCHGTAATAAGGAAARNRCRARATWASGQGWGRAGVGRLVEPDVGPRRRRVRRPKPAAARPTGLFDDLRPAVSPDDLQSEGLASRVVPSSRRGSRAGRYR